MTEAIENMEDIPKIDMKEVKQFAEATSKALRGDGCETVFNDKLAEVMKPQTHHTPETAARRIVNWFTDNMQLDVKPLKKVLRKIMKSMKTEKSKNDKTTFSVTVVVGGGDSVWQHILAIQTELHQNCKINYVVAIEPGEESFGSLNPKQIPSISLLPSSKMQLIE